jgi:hypothetical protein
VKIGVLRIKIIGILNVVGHKNGVVVVIIVFQKILIIV